MIVDQLRLEPAERGMRRSARLRWRDGESRVHITVPEPFAASDAQDASAWLPVSLLCAMRRGEDLELDGLVSPRLLRCSDEVQDLFLAFGPRMSPIAVRPAGLLDPGRTRHGGARSVASCFSRGLDSMHAAAMGRSVEGRIETLVFIDRFESVQSDASRAGEIEQAVAAAEVLGMQSVVTETDLRGFTEQLFGWEDAVGTVLSGVGHALGGGIRHLVIPSGRGPYALGPSGTGPMLDSLFSTETLTIEAASVARGRADKAAWLTRERPDVLPYLKVCFATDRVDNCCRCEKCLQTMISLAAVDGLKHATAFREPLDLDLVGSSGGALLSEGWADLADAVDDPTVDPELRARVHATVARNRRKTTPTGPIARASFSISHKRALTRLIHEGRLDPTIEPALGLVRVVDRRGERHLYGAGVVPPGEIAGELGAVPASASGGTRVWITDDARVVTEVHGVPAVVPGPLARLRWALAPLGWRRSGTLLERLALAVLRGLGTLLRRPLPAAPPQQGVPIGMLHAEEGVGRVPLYSAHHPITGDQLLSTYEWEPVDLGYAGVAHLGFLEARTPVTGRGGIVPLDLPWAAYRGHRIRRA